MNFFPNTCTKEGSGSGIADDEKVIEGWGLRDEVGYAAVGEFAFVGRPDEFLGCVVVVGGEFLGGVGGNISSFSHWNIRC